jgi:hypothetical protein
MSSFSSGGALGGPGKACGKFGGKQTTLGIESRPHEEGFVNKLSRALHRHKHYFIVA